MLGNKNDVLKAASANCRIGVVDSGLGGLSTLINLRELLPGADFIYLADTRNLPYGNKGQHELALAWSKIAKFFKQKQVEIVVVACNTLSTILLEFGQDSFASEYGFKVVDVILPALKSLKPGHNNVGVIATECTVRSRVYQRGILDLRKKPFEVVCPRLVEQLEAGVKPLEIKPILFEYLVQFEVELDVLILGCTHYGLLRTQIDEFFEGNVELIDTNVSVMNAVSSLVGLETAGAGSVELFVTAEPRRFLEVMNLQLRNHIWGDKEPLLFEVSLE